MNFPFTKLTFAQPGWLLLLLPVLLLLLLRKGRGTEAAVSFPNLSILVSLGARVRRTAGGLTVPLLIFSLVCAIIAMARPVKRDTLQSRTASGIDIVIALDVSISMQIADFVDDMRPMQRITAAKLVVDDFIRRRPDDRMGIVAFAGRPRIVSPITLDHRWLRETLSLVRLSGRFQQGTINEQGTAIGSAISASATRLDGRDAKSKIIVLITDGASNSGKISPLEAAELAKELGIRIYTIAIGTKEGRVDRGIQSFPYQEFDLPTLQKIAETTGGESYWAQDLDSLKNTFSTIDQLEKTTARIHTSVRDTELYAWPLSLSLLLALIAAAQLALNPPTTA